MSTNADTVLELQDVSATYANGAITALRSVSMSVPAGAMVALLGANGAGKTTAVRAITGTLPLAGGRRDSGSIRYLGQPIDRRSPASLVRMGITQVMEGRRIFGDLTVEENLRAGGWTCSSRSARTAAMARVFETFPRLADRRSQRAGYLSGGEQQMLAIGRALMPSPKLLILDEPSLGLAPRIVDQIAEILADINRAGTSVVLIEQNTAMALGIADYAYILDQGQIALEGPAATLVDDDVLRELYLGGSLPESVVGS
jgi:branched-chain amino acid transport system ATP-binding protein